jgi:hypothetical protein
MKADEAAQLQFEELYDKNQTMKRLRCEFDNQEVYDQCEKADIPYAFGVDLLCQMVLHKRAAPDVLVGILWRHFDMIEDPDNPGMALYENPYQACADALLRAVDHDFADLTSTETTLVLCNDVDQEVYDDLNRFQYPLPMLVTPAEVTNNKQSGYLKVQGSLILKNNHHEDDICLDHINRVNCVKLTINTDTAQMVQNRWKNLDKRKPGEEHADLMKRRKAFEKYDTTSRDVIDHLMVFDDEFYLTHRYDKRGRTYCQGYHVNYQGTAWNKAVVEFAHQEVCES